MNLKHQFLLAMPGLAGEYFADSLTYICEHNEDGAMGLIINRSADMSLVELFAQLGLPVDHKWVDTPVLEGGPVSPERGIVLHSQDKLYASSAGLDDGLALSTALEVLDDIAAGNGPKKFLVALGYAGWGPGQLEEEIAGNVWLTIDADPQIIFTEDLAAKLDQAARTLGIDIRLIAGKAGHA